MGASPPPPRRGAIFAWCLYDWANSAFPAVVSTFVFATYFTEAVAADRATGTSLWGVAAAVSGVLIALLSPPLGAVADAGGARARMLAAFTAITVLATAALWTVAPQPDHAVRAIALVIVATVAFELATVFYNAMLPVIAPPGRLGRISGFGWGCGYFGGLACLLVALFVLIRPDPAPFGLDNAQAEPVRACMLLVALWIAVFAWPACVLIPDRGPARPWGEAIRGGMAEIAALLRHLPRRPALARFLIARLFYTDGLNTLFAFGAIYAAGKFGMTTEEVLLFGIGLNVTAGLGAAGFALVEDRLGAKATVLVSLAGLMILGAGLLAVEGKTLFWALGLPIGVFMGPAQAASRSLMARMATPGEESAHFGLFALSGRVTAFAGPAVLAATVSATGSQTAGMATVLVFLGLGAVVLTTVRAPG